MATTMKSLCGVPIFPLNNTGSDGIKSKTIMSGAVPKKKHKALPPLFWYMEMGDWDKAVERAKRHPREVKTWATIKTKSKEDESVSGTKRLALHHACFKLRSVHPTPDSDPFIQVCEFILLLLQMYPEASGMRESRHGCLPLHLAAFASCAPRPEEADGENSARAVESSVTPGLSLGSGSYSRPNAGHSRSLSDPFNRPHGLANHTRSVSEATTDSTLTSCFHSEDNASAVNISVKSNIFISVKREEMAVKVMNALLDAFPKGIRVDSEGGRLPLHTACAGRATPRVIATLLTAYPAAARHRNKDGFLPLHLSAHWGVSHPNAAVALLKTYPDATLGRNRWERTPLEEALSMAGENGRTHQAALVRALRKHPSYWTRPPEELFRMTAREEHETRHQIVDMDETIPDDETSNGPKLLTEPQPRNGPPAHETTDLATLIKNQDWSEVELRIEMNPHECGETLGLVTRGGFMPSAGMTPLHYACERRPPVDVIAALVAVWPEAVTTRLQPGGALPLHIACTWQASVGVVSTLCQVEPATCRIPDELGNVPLHCAAFSGAMAPVVDGLLRVFPRAVLARNHQGSLPSDIVKRLRHENRRNVLSLLKMRKEEVLSAQHNRSKSAGANLGGFANRAIEMNASDGAPNSSLPSGAPLGMSIGENQEVVEFGANSFAVPYQPPQNNQEEMIWI